MPAADIDLMSLFWTTAGIYAGTGDISPRDFTQRVRSAANAGFSGIGLWHTDLEHVCIHHSLKEMRSILDDHGMRFLELEFLTDWFVTGQRRNESDARRKRLLEASAILEASHVKVGDFYNAACPFAQIVDAFAGLCVEAKQFGATIGFEFMGASMLNNLQDSLTLIEEADQPNGGLILDIAHVVGLGISYDSISALPASRLVSVEIQDGTLPGSAHYDPLRARRYCGEGEFDIKGFVSAVQRTGFRGPWGVEIISRELVDRDIDEVNRRAYAATMAQFGG